MLSIMLMLNGHRLPFESALVDDCLGRGKSMQEGGAIYNFTGLKLLA